jgi:hypothetical protein
MDLLSKAVITAVVMIAIVLVLLFIKSYTVVHAPPLNATSASKLVISDLQQSYPNASVRLLSVNRSYVRNNSWEITLGVIYGPATPCPTVKIESFDYPATGLVPTVTNVYSNYSSGTCHVYGLPNSALPYFSYTVSSPEIAIDRAYNADYAPLVSFINASGFNNITASANFYGNTTLLGKNYTNIWLVKYLHETSTSQESQFVVMNYSGSVLTGYIVMLNYTKNFTVK